MLPQEMNTPIPGRTLTQHRKVAVHFRDTALLKVRSRLLCDLKGPSRSIAKRLRILETLRC